MENHHLFKGKFSDILNEYESGDQFSNPDKIEITIPKKNVLPLHAYAWNTLYNFLKKVR